MKKVVEKSYLLLISLGIGCLVGATDSLFGQVLLAVSNFREQHYIELLPFLSIAGCLIIFLYKKWGSGTEKGMGLVFEVGNTPKQKVPKRLLPLVMVSTWITHLFGGSAGREGVAVQIGASLAGMLQRGLKFSSQKRLFLMVGMAAGFSGLFQTPIAASFFAVEVLVIGKVEYKVLPYAVVAAYSASTTSSWLGLEKFTFPLKQELTFTPEVFLKLFIAGSLFGLVGWGFAWLLKKTKKIASLKLSNPYCRVVLLGLVLSLLFLFFQPDRYAGLGTNLIAASFSGAKIMTYDWISKLLLTVLTLAAGFQGGEVTPLFAIGTTLGVVLAQVLGLPVLAIAACGYICVFSAATKTLFAPIFIGAEVFGYTHLVYFVPMVVIAYGFSGKQSIYNGQKLVCEERQEAER
ncbi:chloride channel protein [Vagococcus entomophilus]|uniref:Voltage-gated chloride channel protein n=1 Tax=Vagococcus entomophilus TaxID=1160095 RepID=A0A430AJ06_9ENTE|nr:chloride channel protein [Vagococcus entomophilus]RSU08018.1 voltage-gated chloride channel protein [Vagococcus entomophilus]